MANLVRLRGDTAELPYLSIRYPVAPAESSLREGLAAYRDLQLQVGLQSLPLARREEVIAFLRRFGMLLHRTLFPQGQARRLHPGLPILLETDAGWGAMPWELLHDGRQWLAVQQGLVRFHAGGGAPESRVPASSVLAVAALPVPVAPDDALSAAYRETGARFITPIADLPDSGAHEGALNWRIAEHADRKTLEHELRDPPHILLWSGLAGPKSWFLEGAHLEPETLPVAQLADWLRASRGATRVLVVNDSLGLSGSPHAADQASALLGAGLPALIRVEGAQARVRQQDYLRALFRHMAQGFSTFESHLSALRRLHRRFEAGWDWSYLRFHTRQIPAPPEPGDTLRREGRDGAAPRAAGMGQHAAPRPALRPAPPVFRPRRRVFARHAELRALSQALLPAQAPSSPFVFVHGPAGSGKTVLASDIARRAQRRFDEIVHLDAATLLPDPARGAQEAGLTLRKLAPLERYAAALAVRLGVQPANDSAGALSRVLEDGARRLIILDGWDGRPVFEEWLNTLARAPAAQTRIVVITRAPPPVLPGFRIELRPLDAEGFAAVLGEEFLERIRARLGGNALFDACRRDLLLARVLRRLARWPEPHELARLLDPAASASSAEPLLAWAAQQALRELGAPARAALHAILLLTGMVHQDTVAQVSGLDARGCTEALTALQWAGLADSHDGERYVSLHPRLSLALGEKAMTRGVFAPLAPRLGLAYESYLATVARTAGAAHAHSAWHAPEAGFAWLGANRPVRNSADPRDVQRLAIERSNLVEASLILSEEGDLRALARWNEEARPLLPLAWLADLNALLGTHLLAAAARSGDAGLQARALNRIGAALLTVGGTEQAGDVVQRALDFASRHADWEALSEAYLSMARAHARRSQFDAAENLLTSAVELAYQLGAGEPLVAALSELTALWSRLAPERDGSAQFLPRAIAFLEERHQLHLAASLRRLLGEMRARAGGEAQAEQELRLALRAFQRFGDRREAGLTGLALAGLLARQERADPAQDLFDESVHALREARAADPVVLAGALERLAKLYERQRRVPEAIRAWREVRDWREQAADREGVIAVLDVLGSLYFGMGEQEQSTRCYEERLLLQAEVAAHA